MARFAVFAFACFVLACCIPASGWGQAKTPDKTEKKPPPAANQELSSPEMAEAMKALMPGKVHEQLATLVGKWKVTSSISVGGADQGTTEGNSEMKMILGGRFVQETGDGSMMGFPVEHARLWGYNNGSKKYQALWLYTMSTGFLTMEGESPDDGKTINWKGQFDNEIGVREELTAVTKFIDKDHFVVELSAGKMPDGSEGPTLKADYVRAK